MPETRESLLAKRCKPCEGGMLPMSGEEIVPMLRELGGWDYREGSIVKQYKFSNFYETIGFVNAIAWMANREDHHPDLEVSYKTCTVRYTTHAIGGLSENDFICAAKVDALVA